MKAISIAIGASLLLAPSAMAAIEQTVPGAYQNTPGTASFLGPLANAQRTYQLLIHANQLTDLVGLPLTALTWRNPVAATTAWPVSDVTFTNYDIYLSGSVDPANRSLTFADNIVGPQTKVRDGGLTILANSFPGGGSPNDFGQKIEFDSPWLYSGGNLLVEIRHTGFTGTSRSVDALGTATAGYGTDFSAAWTGNYAGTSGSQGNFSIVQLTAVPTPSAAALLGLGLLVGARRRR